MNWHECNKLRLQANSLLCELNNTARMFLLNDPRRKALGEICEQMLKVYVSLVKFQREYGTPDKDTFEKGEGE